MPRTKKNTKQDDIITIEELEQLRKSFPKPPDICKWIRDNIPESKLAEVKEYLMQYNGYFDVNQSSQMIEHVYRGVKNSIKIKYAYTETFSFAGWLVYLLSPDKTEPDFKNVEADLLKIVGEKSFLYDFLMQAKDANNKVEKKGSAIPYYVFDKVSLTWLGANVMFYYMLTSVVHVIEKSYADKGYKFKNPLDWQEAITSYVLHEFVKIGENVIGM